MINRDEAIVVLATYNEADNIAEVLEGLRDFSVLVVDDSSPDGTGEIAGEYEHVEVLSRSGKLGIASAYLDGFAIAREKGGRYIIQMDAGMTHKPADVSRLLEQAEATQSDLVIGSRFLSRGFHGYRTLISCGAAFLMRRLGIKVRDATSGFRCWRTDRMKKLDFSSIRARGFAFQLELLYQTWSGAGKITEMPIEYQLTNSSFNAKMLAEAMNIYFRLCGRRLGRIWQPLKV